MPTGAHGLPTVYSLGKSDDDDGFGVPPVNRVFRLDLAATPASVGPGVPGWPLGASGAGSAVRPARAAAREFVGYPGMAKTENVAYKRSQRAFFGREVLWIEESELWPVERNSGRNAARSLSQMSIER